MRRAELPDCRVGHGTYGGFADVLVEIAAALVRHQVIPFVRDALDHAAAAAFAQQFAGRAFGMLLFIVLAKVFSEDIALRYALVIVGAIQMLSLPLAKNIIKEIDGNK